MSPGHIPLKNLVGKTRNYNLVTQKAQKGTSQIFVGYVLCFLFLLWLIFFVERYAATSV